MGRKPREEFIGGIYHVIHRSNNQEFIFKDGLEKGYFIKQLKDFHKAMNYRIYGYCLMDTHYHLIIQTMGEQLHKIMHRLNSKYSKFFNSKNERTGHVFWDRYKSIPVYDEKYLLALLRYIHQNPIRANICSKVEEYEWSSDHLYRTNQAEWIHKDLILDMLSSNRNKAIKQYGELMLQEETEDYSNIDSIGLEVEAPQVSLPVEVITIEPLSLDEILWETEVGEREFQLIKQGSRKKGLKQFKLAYISMALDNKYTLRAIGANINITDVAVLNIIKRNKLVN